jgi:hypothetical protein
VKRADPQLRDRLTPLVVLLAIGEGVVGPGVEGVVGPGVEGVVGPGVVGLPILVVSLIMMRTLRMTSLPFNQTVRLEFNLVGKSCGEV